MAILPVLKVNEPDLHGLMQGRLAWRHERELYLAEDGKLSLACSSKNPWNVITDPINRYCLALEGAPIICLTALSRM